MTAPTAIASPGFYTSYNAGRFNGQGANLIMFSFYGPEGRFGSCRAVEEQEAAAELAAIRRNGWVPLPAGGKAT